ncbi:MAG: glutamate--cysteine ligase, partial [Mycobacterium sp.]|nr:glutamate--cysteine ligase [Mycobacterium sp.]
MTFAMTSEVDDAHPSHANEAELTSAYSAAEHIGESCLVDGPVGCV